MPLFSVIIPTYNRADLLSETLASVSAQTFKDYEVIVVDDGSTDQTLEILRDYPGLKVLTQTNRGPGAARNHGVRHCSGQYLAFLDSDDVWFPWSLETYAAIIRQTSASFLAGKPFRFRNQADLPMALPDDVTHVTFPDYLASGDDWRWWGVSSFIIRRDVFTAAGGFVESNINSEDADLALTLGMAPCFVQMTSPPTFGYREHEANVTSNLSKSLEGLWHMINKEQANGYPGGAKRATERRRIMTRHIRPVTLECLKQGRGGDAWSLYRATFGWHLLLGRWKYLAGFPVKALFKAQ